MGKGARKILRLEAAERQNYLCYWCGRRMFIKGEVEWNAYRSRRLTAEHLVPRSRGGRDVPGNIVAACNGCNQRRGAPPPPPNPVLR